MLHNTINTIISDAKTKYTLPTSWDFTKAVKSDDSLAKQYRSREIFELLQNIDDQYDPDSEHQCVASISLRDGWLEVSNYGQPFTHKNLMRLCEGDASGKDEKYIGCKGIGFRSVLNWADEIEIYSGHGKDYISVGFSRTYAQKLLDEIKDNDKIREQIQDLERLHITPRYPIFKAPYYVEPIEKEFDTVIRLKIKPDVPIESITEEMLTFDKRVLLFLPNIREVWMDTGDQRYTIVKEVDGSGHVNITKTQDDDVDTETFLVGEKESPMPLKSDSGESYVSLVKMAVALHCQTDMANTETFTLHTFFPIKDELSPFPALLHATFRLSPNRNTLDRNEDVINKEVFKQLLEFYVDFVVEQVEGHQRLHMLMPCNYNIYHFRFLSESLRRYGLEDFYMAYCASKPIIYSVTGEYLTPKTDSPVVLSTAPACFKGEAFHMVSIIENSLLSAFAQKLSGDVDAQTILADAINAKSMHWTSNQRMHVLTWWNAMRYYKTLPLLLKDSHGNFFDSKTQTIFLTSPLTSQEILPSFARISVVDADDEAALIEELDQRIKDVRDREHPDWSDKRIVANEISKYVINLREQSSRNDIISPVNDSIGQDVEHVHEFVSWLFAIWRKEPFANELKRIQYRLLADDDTVVRARSLYLTHEYGNAVGEKILCHLNGMKPLKYLNLGDDVTEDEAQRFFMDLGVLKYPVISNPEPGDKDLLEADWWQNHLEYEYINREIRPQVDSFKFALKVRRIEGLRNILKSVDFVDVMAWIYSDEDLRKELKVATSAGTNAQVKYCLRGGRKYYGLSINRIPSFLRYAFGSEPWITIDGERYAPRQLLMCNDEYLSQISPAYITEAHIKGWAKTIAETKDEVKSLLMALGMRTSYLQLSSTEFYDLLLALPGTEPVEKSKRTSRDIYRAVIENWRSEGQRLTAFYDDSQEKHKFFDDGFLLAKDVEGISDYRHVKDVFFSSSAVVHPEGKYLIDIPARSGNKERFADVFNVMPFEQTYEVNEHLRAAFDTEFQHDFSDFLKYLMAYRQADTDKVGDLRVTLVSHAIVKVGTSVYDYDTQYGLLRCSPKHWLIYVGDLDVYSSIDRLQVAFNLQQVFNVLFDAPSREFLDKVILLYMNPMSRKTFVKNELGILDDELRSEGHAITLRRKHFQQLRIAYNRQVERYKVCVYSWFYDRPQEWTGLKEAWAAFSQYGIGVEDIESEKFDAEATVSNYMMHCLSKFGITEPLDTTASIEYGVQYNENLKKLQELATDMAYVNDFTNDYANDSLLYFPAWDEIEHRFNQMVKATECETKVQDTTSDALNALIERSSIVDTVNPGVRREPVMPLMKTVSSRSKRRSDARKQNQGDIAEYLTVIKLAKGEVPEVKDFLGDDYKIKWVSGASRRICRVEEYDYDITESDDSLGYDISVTSADATRTIYIEVKSTSGSECSFDLSVNEYNMARKVAVSNNELYRVVLVFGLDLSREPSPKIAFIDRSITDDEFFDVHPTNYHALGKDTINPNLE